jgi:tRNA threonylcarbamoyladenosine biosynthesis protein TsaB
MKEKTKEKFALFIDTSNNRKTVVKIGNSKLEENYSNPKDQKLLEVIDRLLKKAKLDKMEIKEIKINTGPGSYTGLRVGCSVANTLAWSLGIKVNGKNRVEANYN